MTDMESLDRAVEEARQAILDYTNDRWEHVNPRLDRLMEAVSAKARAEERERLLAVPPCPHPESEVYWVDDSRSICAMCGADSVEPARSSEEAVNGG